MGRDWYKITPGDPDRFLPKDAGGAGVYVPVMDVYTPGPPHLAVEPSVYAADLKNVASEQTHWVWNGYVAKGSTTLLTSLWKSGKTTLLSHLLAALAKKHSDFCGRALTPVKSLVVSEESKSVWAQRVRQLDITENVWVSSRPLTFRPDSLAWVSLLQHVVQEVKQFGIGLVVFDPLANFMPGEENVAGAMLEFLMPLAALTKQNVAVLLLHHPRKMDGTEGRASRGSGALPGYVDILMEMRRAQAGPDTRIRVLSAYSRYEATPGELLIELATDNSGYRVVGSRRDLYASDLRHRLQEVLASAPHGLTSEEIRQAWPEHDTAPSLRTLEKFLHEGLEKQWDRSGSGSKGSPYRYILRTAVGSQAQGTGLSGR